MTDRQAKMMWLNRGVVVPPALSKFKLSILAFSSLAMLVSIALLVWVAVDWSMNINAKLVLLTVCVSNIISASKAIRKIADA